MRLLVSACLLGVCCRYDGQSRPDERVLSLGKRHTLIPVCPEQLGGLPTPRTPCERKGDRVVSAEGEDRTAAYQLGARQAEKLYDMLGCACAVLKARSPMCGSGAVYDGRFNRTLVPGNGVLAERLIARGVPVWSEENLPESL